MDIFQGDAHSPLMSFSDSSRDLAANSSNLALQLPEPGLLSVLLNDGGERRLGDVQVARRDAVLLNLLRQQVTTSDLAFLFFRVARQAYHLHAVAKRRLNRVENIGGGHKH